ncbi:hypothetical protein BGY98DRAFT_935522 [Russula aff. rugulosa BPL654]|nr:hypothetical protein BGY98DRAFT_935522 [Russula aff. rugulosa BPL654]
MVIIEETSSSVSCRQEGGDSRMDMTERGVVKKAFTVEKGEMKLDEVLRHRFRDRELTSHHRQEPQLPTSNLEGFQLCTRLMFDVENVSFKVCLPTIMNNSSPRLAHFRLLGEDNGKSRRQVHVAWRLATSVASKKPTGTGPESGHLGGFQATGIHSPSTPLLPYISQATSRWDVSMREPGHSDV